MSGSKHYGHVTGNPKKRGKYYPSEGSFNFAVPNIKMLLKHCRQIDKLIQSGILSSAFWYSWQY